MLDIPDPAFCSAGLFRARRPRPRPSDPLDICCTTPDAAAATPEAICATEDATSATRFNAPLVPDLRAVEPLRLDVFLADVFRVDAFRAEAFRPDAFARPRALDARRFFDAPAERAFAAAVPRRFAADDLRPAEALRLLAFRFPVFRAAIVCLP